MVSLPYKRVTSAWILTITALFIISIILGIVMRLNQGGALELSGMKFYSVMTVHGVTMVGIWFVAGMLGVNYLLLRYVSVPLRSSVIAMVMTVLGVVAIWYGSFVGNFNPAWTFLYPLPFFGPWATWALPLFLAALGVLCLGWTVWTVSMLKAIFKKYSLSQAFGWQAFSKAKADETPPPLILISTVTLLGIFTCLITGLVVVALFFVEYFSGKPIDPLLMKNLTYFFGHTIANEFLYLGIAALYELLPEVTGRPKFKITWYVALGWNATLIFVLFAFFHHMYMDFVQPLTLQVIGQFASYFAALPAVAVTLFSVLVLVYRNPIRWSNTAILFFLGVMGWVIGGVGAVIDATISNNFILHNTLWVPAHFHTYIVMGSVLFSLAFFNWVAFDFSGETEPNKISRTFVGLLLVGGFGFLLMFYLSGAYSIPRRFDVYPKALSIGALFALIAAGFATIYLIAIIQIGFNVVKRCIRVFGSPSSSSSAGFQPQLASG